MSEEQKDGAMSQYGPPMSPAIFAQKWRVKFEDLLTAKFFGVDNDDINWISDVSEEGYEHLLHFHSQATQLGLREQDFPEASCPDLDARPSNPRAEAAKLCGSNPVFTANALAHLIHPFISRLRAMKHGRRVCGVPWQQLPLSLRQRTNELVLKVEDAQKACWWAISEEEDKVMMEEFRAREQLGYPSGELTGS